MLLCLGLRGRSILGVGLLRWFVLLLALGVVGRWRGYVIGLRGNELVLLLLLLLLGRIV